MNVWKRVTASALAIAAGAALCIAPASAQTRYPLRHAPSAATLHRKAVMNAHRATRAARNGHPMRSERYAAKAQRQYNRSYRTRMHRNSRMY